MSDPATIEFLAGLPLLEGWSEAELERLSGLLGRRTVNVGETIFRQGAGGREIVFIVDGALTASLHVPGDRAVDISEMRRGEMLGEISVLDQGAHTMTVRVTEPATLLTLSRVDLAALLAPLDAVAFRLRRRLAELLTARHRGQLQQLAASLDGAEQPKDGGDVGRAFADLTFCGPPDSRYMRRIAQFHGLDSLALWGLTTSGRYAQCAPGQTLLAEGVSASACFMTINGAVEKVLVRGSRQIRVGLAGPGRPFGYESLIDAGPSPVTAITRERALLLVLEPTAFRQLFHGEDAVARVFSNVILGDLVSTLRQTLRPQARLSGSV